MEIRWTARWELGLFQVSAGLEMREKSESEVDAWIPKQARCRQ